MGILPENVQESDDVLQMIFLNLPMEDLARCKSVCKHWNSLISQRRFSVQLSPTPNRTMLLDRFAIWSGYIIPRHNGVNSLERAIPLRSPYLFSLGECCKVIGTCDGLICAATQAGDAVVWNPVLKQKRAFSFPKVKDGGFSVFGFGLDKVCEDYKVLKVTPTSSQTIVQIWNLYCPTRTSRESSRGHPRTIKFPSSRVAFLLKNVDPVTVNGACHWIAVSLRSKKLELVRFDMERETFIEIPFSRDMPNVEVTGADGQKCSPEIGIDGKQFSLGTYDMQLCLLISTSSGVEIWCLGKNLSWKRRFHINKKKEHVLGFSANDEIVTQHEDGEILARNADTLRIVFPMVRMQKLPKVVTYVESIVPLELAAEIGGSNQKKARSI